jgi:uncharacterized protein YwgA
MDEPLIREDEVRAAVIYDLVDRLGDIGKTQVQKLLYFLQEQYGLPLGCSFYIHQYGPYADEIETTVSNLKFMEYLTVQPDPQGYGFHLRSESPPEEAWSEITKSAQAELDDLVAKLGSRDARELELLTTIHYASRSTEAVNEQLVSFVRSLKPKFSELFIRRKCEELLENGLL